MTSSSPLVLTNLKSALNELAKDNSQDGKNVAMRRSENSTASTAELSSSSEHSASTISTLGGRRVTFGSIDIREYNRTVGDHPDCKAGPPMTLAWEFQENPSMSLDQYEETRKRRRTERQLLMTSITRHNILFHHFGISEEEMSKGAKAAEKVAKLRYRTSHQSKLLDKTESRLLGAKRLFVSDPIKRLKKLGGAPKAVVASS